ncbi:DUF1311 domain-containing protein [Sphingomonas sp. TF3]|uniref:lysozyme inhibitor LprI family protein n=1 Tax=Sphingomonas sp. TF3 TaxID=2495580 RepID=UPI000F895DBF|nr:lysozyme inhibitor LprI family protein [Sphingomonas sp. TF3]RUN75524.1 DUF1311 domain-containing protein [Sphingomonas sp. TF3]
MAALLLQASAVGACEAGADAEISACWAVAAATADADLNRIWPDVVASARAADKGFGSTQRRARPSAAADLIAAERAWVLYRDKQCALEADYAQGGSLEAIISSQCVTDMTRQRIKQLRAIAVGFREG